MIYGRGWTATRHTTLPLVVPHRRGERPLWPQQRLPRGVRLRRETLHLAQDGAQARAPVEKVVVALVDGQPGEPSMRNGRPCCGLKAFSGQEGEARNGVGCGHVGLEREREAHVAPDRRTRRRGRPCRPAGGRARAAAARRRPPPPCGRPAAAPAPRACKATASRPPARPAPRAPARARRPAQSGARAASAQKA